MLTYVLYTKLMTSKTGYSTCLYDLQEQENVDLRVRQGKDSTCLHRYDLQEQENVDLRVVYKTYDQ